MKLNKILKIVSEVSGISEDILRSKSKFREIVIARNIYFLLSVKTNHSLKEVANVVNRDHSTTIYGRKTAVRDIETNYLNSAKLFKKCKRKIEESKIKQPIFRDISSLEIKETNLINLIKLNWLKL